MNFGYRNKNDINDFRPFPSQVNRLRDLSNVINWTGPQAQDYSIGNQEFRQDDIKRDNLTS